MDYFFVKLHASRTYKVKPIDRAWRFPKELGWQIVLITLSFEVVELPNGGPPRPPCEIAQDRPCLGVEKVLFCKHSVDSTTGQTSKLILKRDLGSFLVFIASERVEVDEAGREDE